MSDEHHGPRTVERHCDVAVVGGSAAGLAAALQLGRQRRSTIVIDSGEPRNAPAAHVHGYLTREGGSPSELLAVGREEVRSYGGEILRGRATTGTRLDAGPFGVERGGGPPGDARRVLAATGLVDQLPDIDGLTERWGRDVVHCPFCHGYELRDRRIVLIVAHPMALHPAPLWAQLTDQLTVVLHDGVEVDGSELDGLRARGVDVLSGVVQRLVEGEGRLEAVELDDGRTVVADAVAVGPRFAVRAEPFAALDLHPTPHPMGAGDHLATDATGQTAVPGVYAAGNVTDPSQQVLQAAADGSRTGAMISFDLAREDGQAEDVRPSSNEADWQHRYESDQMWSGNPNGTLVAELASMAPGRALDVGAGEGADALWLAEQGWVVTANDISQRALDRLRAEAERRRLQVRCVQGDANARAPFGPGEFDAVTAMYASIPRTPDGRALANVLTAVAPGGTLLVVSHDLEPMRSAVDPATHSQAFDPDAYVRVEDFAAALADDEGWDIEVHGLRPRPKGSATDAHHVDDLVLRARRVGRQVS